MQTVAKEIAANRRAASAQASGNFQIRRVTKSGKIGAVVKHWQTGRSEFAQAEALLEAARLNELNGEGRFVVREV